LRADFRVTHFFRPRRPSDGAFLLGPVRWSAAATEDNATNSIADIKTAGPAPGATSETCGLIIRALEPSDWPGVAALMERPKVRWGTLRLPFASKEQWRKKMENPSDDRTQIVAALDGSIVGEAGIWHSKGRRRHAGGVGLCVHDDFHRRGIGKALLAALIDVADNWLDLKRLELTVYVDNTPAIALYTKFGFEVEGTRRADAFRDGQYVDSFEMARLRPGWRRQ
jgi:L-phenylalanine/L-methionine N-acetyltransferase